MKVLLVLIDGCRVDSLASARTPMFDALMAQGCWTMEARTVSPSVTLPVLCSIFTSTPPVHHGVMGNLSAPVPGNGTRTLPEQLRAHGRRSAFCYNWEQVKWVTPPGSLHASLFLDTNLSRGGDAVLASAAVPLLVAERPDFAFLYLGCLDEEGHRSGFASDPYIAALEAADSALEKTLDTMERAGCLDDYVVIVQSDHGGQGHEHFDPVPATMTVPWIACGPGVRSGHRIAAPVSVLDTAPTIAALMGVPPHAAWAGKPVEELGIVFP
jgi:predicted AlkP superfamily pyrophosphatase or phosphodiesterase